MDQEEERLFYQYEIQKLSGENEIQLGHELFHGTAMEHIITTSGQDLSYTYPMTRN